MQFVRNLSLATLLLLVAEQCTPRMGEGNDGARYEFAKHYPDSRAQTAAAWLKQHGAQGGAGEMSCWDAGERVGMPPSAGVLCLTTVDNPPETVARIYRQEGPRAREVWRGTVRTWTNWLELTPLLSPDGAVLEVHDRAPGRCEHALCEFQMKEASQVKANFGNVLRRGCAQRGTYVYEKGRYVARTLAARVQNPCSGEI